MNAHAPDPPATGDRLLTWRQVKDLAGISRTTAWRLCNRGQFPQPVEISPGRVAWREQDVAAWRAALRPRNGATPALGDAPQQPDPIERAPAPLLPQPPSLIDQRRQAAVRTPRSLPRKRPRRPVKDTAQLSFDF